MAIVIEAAKPKIETSPEPTDLVGRIDKLMPPSAEVMWADVQGLPARDDHPGLGFKGYEDFSDTMAGTIVIERDHDTQDGFSITLWPSEGEVGRPISQKSLPEITGGNDSQRFKALQVAFMRGEQVRTMQGLLSDGTLQKVEGLYGEDPSATQTPDAHSFAMGCLKVLELSKSRKFYSAQASRVGKGSLRLVS